MKLKAKKILIGMITFIFLFASAYVAHAMGGGMGGTGMSGAQMAVHSGYSEQMDHGNSSHLASAPSAAGPAVAGRSCDLDWTIECAPGMYGPGVNAAGPRS